MFDLLLSRPYEFRNVWGVPYHNIDNPCIIFKLILKHFNFVMEIFQIINIIVILFHTVTSMGVQ